ncbi:cytochrome P450 [Aspergillus aurantiobrunneus]
MSEEATRLFRGDILDSWSHSAKQALSPGSALDAQNLRMGNQGLVEVTDLLKQGEIELLAWTKHAVVQATASGLYGLRHPLKDPEIKEAMWVWDEQRLGHMVGIDPLGTGYRARAKVWDAFPDYFRNVPYDVSLLVKERQDILRKAGISEAEAARMQSTLCDAAYPNTVPTLFWTVHEIFSRPELLEVVRDEIYSSAVQKTDTGFVLDVAALKSKCQVLLSVYQETQRTRHYQVAFRAITEDTLLDRHLLKKGNYLQILSKPTHHNLNIWGPDTSNFDPYRFVPGGTKTKISPSCFQPWGVPPHMCPARRFAFTEILIITALLCCRVDLAPVSSKGWIREPALRSMEIPSLPRPRTDVRLRVTERDDAVGNWAITMGDSKTRVPLASG